MPKLRYNPKTGKMEPEVMTYGKDNFQAGMPMQSPSPMVNQGQMIRQSQQERSQGMPTAANAYAPASSGDPFMDKIKGILAAGAPAVTNTDEFQKMMPEAYAGNQNMQDLQKSYEQRYRDSQIALARPGYTDAQIEEHLKVFNQDGSAVYTPPAYTEQPTSPIGPETLETDTFPPANPAVDPRREFAGQTSTPPPAQPWDTTDPSHPANFGFTGPDGGVNSYTVPTDAESNRGLALASMFGMAAAPGLAGMYGAAPAAAAGGQMVQRAGGVPAATEVVKSAGSASPVQQAAQWAQTAGPNALENAVAKFGLTPEQAKEMMRIMRQMPVHQTQAMLPY